MTKHELAEWLHDNYEQIAKSEKWQTQEITRVKFEDLPAENKSTMLALADRMLNTFNFITSNTMLADSFVGRDEEDAKVIAEAKKMWSDTEIPQRKLKAVKYMMEHGWGLKVAHDYCQQNFCN